MLTHDISDLIRLASVVAWLICLSLLLPAVIRLVRRRGRYLDPIWGIIFLLGLNRMSFIMRWSSDWSQLTAAALAICMGFFARWYQHHDA